MKQPEGFIQPGQEHLVCRLYGLKQEPHCWNHALGGHLKEIEFEQIDLQY